MKFNMMRVLVKTGHCLLVLVASSYVLLIFLTNPGLNGYDPAAFVAMVHGQAFRPYVYRLLVPTLIRWISPVFASVSAPYTFRTWELEYFPQYLTAVILLFVFLIGFYFAFRYLFQSIYRTSTLFLDLASLLVLLCLPTFFRYYNYIYDLATVCLFTLGLALLVNRKWVFYMAAFIIGCLNKETSILLPFIFGLYYWKRLDRRKFLILLAMQAAIFMAIREGIVYAFRTNPGVSPEWHLLDHNLPLILQPYPVSLIASMLFLAVLVFYGWTEKPEFLKVSLLTFPVLLGMAFLFGYLDELRAYYEAYPVLALLIVYSVAKLLDLSIRSSPELAPIR